MKLLLLLVVIASLHLSISQASELSPAFAFTAKEFQAKLNAKILEDSTDKAAADTIKQCTKVPTGLKCSFRDTQFQRTIVELKRLNLIDGRFSLKTLLFLDLDATGYVTRIGVVGDRSDFANLMETVALVTNVAQTFDPAAGSGGMKKYADSLGLMRGDSAPDIGTTITNIESYARIQCLSMPSQVTTLIGCNFVPRS